MKTPVDEFITIAGHRFWWPELEVIDHVISEFPWEHTLKGESWIVYGIGLRKRGPLAAGALLTVTENGRDRPRLARNIGDLLADRETLHLLERPGWFDFVLRDSERLVIDVSPRPRAGALLLSLNTFRKQEF